MPQCLKPYFNEKVNFPSLYEHYDAIGFDAESFTGPFLSVLAITVYILPMLILELYFRIGDRGGVVGRRLVAIAIGIAIGVLTLLMGLGIFGATMGMWVPRVFT